MSQPLSRKAASAGPAGPAAAAAAAAAASRGQGGQNLQGVLVSDGQRVTPGHCLGAEGVVVCGDGTYALQGFVYACVLGAVSIHASSSASSSSSAALSAAAASSSSAAARGVMISVIRQKQATLLPEIGDLVLCKVTKINQRMAYVSIISVRDQLLEREEEHFPAVIRARDVRAFDVDDVKVQESFRPGDIVRGRVISLGDARSYYLSTAENELGVVLAQSAAGHTMVPISWQEMQCPITHVKELRKVAKVS